MIDPMAGVAQAAVKIALDEVEQKFIHTAVETLKDEVIDTHVDQVLALRKQYPLQNIEILSTNLAMNSSLPQQVRQKIASFQAKMRAVIEKVAEEIEVQKYQHWQEAIDRMDLSLVERGRVNKLISAEKNFHTSLQSLKVAAEVFAYFNDKIIEKVEQYQKQSDIKRERDYVLANAILVYELNDFLINYIEKYQVNGLDELNLIEQEMKQKLMTVRQEHEVLKNQAGSEEITDNQVRAQVLKNIENRIKTMESVEAEWGKYADAVSGMKTNALDTKKEIPTLKLIRDDARSQIAILDIMAVTQIVKNNIEALNSAIVTVKRIKLLPLTPDMAFRMLNINAA